MNKTGIIAKIQSVLTGNATKTTRAEHEEALYNDASSVVEGFYGSSLSDTQTTETYTTKNANFNYTITITKNGNMLNIDAICDANANLGGILNTIFTISENDLRCSGKGYGFIDNSKAGITALDTGTVTNIILTDPILSGQRVYFNITFNSIN